MIARLCVIPMTQEARGLDAGPRLVQRLRCLGDPCSAALVERIASEEVAHVAVGGSLPCDAACAPAPLCARLRAHNGAHSGCKTVHCAADELQSTC